jgi:hypothetical protein
MQPPLAVRRYARPKVGAVGDPTCSTQELQRSTLGLKAFPVLAAKSPPQACGAAPAEVSRAALAAATARPKCS